MTEKCVLSSEEMLTGKGFFSYSKYGQWFLLKFIVKTVLIFIYSSWIYAMFKLMSSFNIKYYIYITSRIHSIPVKWS